MAKLEEKQYTVNVYYKPVKEYYNGLERIAAETHLSPFSASGLFFPSGDVEEDLANTCKKVYVSGLNPDENPDMIFVQYVISEKKKFSSFIKRLSKLDFIKAVSFKADYK